MADKEGDPPGADVNAALLGMPVTQSRRHQGKTQAQYLEERAGRETLTAERMAGLTRLRYQRTMLIGLGVFGVVAVAGGLLFWILIA